jgi:hypothetical protein
MTTFEIVIAVAVICVVWSCASVYWVVTKMVRRGGKKDATTDAIMMIPILIFLWIAQLARRR